MKLPSLEIVVSGVISVDMQSISPSLFCIFLFFHVFVILKDNEPLIKFCGVFDHFLPSYEVLNCQTMSRQDHFDVVTSSLLMNMNDVLIVAYI